VVKMLNRYFLILLSPLLIISCSSNKIVTSSASQPTSTPPISGGTSANNASEAKSNLDVWSTEIEVCKPSQPCFITKASTIGKPTKIGFLYYRDNNNGAPLALAQATQIPLAKMPVVEPMRGIFNNFDVRVLLESNGLFSGIEKPSANPSFFPLQYSAGSGGDPKDFYKDFNTISYTIKSMTQLNAQEQAAVAMQASSYRDEMFRQRRQNINRSSRHEFQPEDMQGISSGTITLKPQQVEPIVVGQKVGLKKW
jgi:hypothetical protein